MWAHQNFVRDGTHTDAWCQNASNVEKPTWYQKKEKKIEKRTRKRKNSKKGKEWKKVNKYFFSKKKERKKRKERKPFFCFHFGSSFFKKKTPREKQKQKEADFPLSTMNQQKMLICFNNMFILNRTYSILFR